MEGEVAVELLDEIVRVRVCPLDGEVLGVVDIGDDTGGLGGDGGADRDIHQQSSVSLVRVQGQLKSLHYQLECFQCSPIKIKKTNLFFQNIF